MSFLTFRLCLPASFLLLACGGTIVESDGEGGSSSQATSGQTNGQTNGQTSGDTSVTTGQGAGDPGGPCPSTVPGPSVACSDPNLICTYGSDPRPECRASAYCNGATFTSYEPVCDPEPGICPTSPPPVTTCVGYDGATCSYSDGTLCSCTGCFGGGPCSDMPSWRCGAPTQGCPTFTPNSGTICATEGQQCSYGNACSGSGAELSCTNGRWLWQQVACPL